MIKKLMCAAVAALMLAGVGSAFASESGDVFTKIHAFGVRVSVGYEYDIELNAQIGIGQKHRVEAGINAGFGVAGDVLYLGYGAFGSYHWRFPISNDGFMAWYAGPALAVGHYVATDLYSDADEGLVLGVGAQVGIEFNFGNVIKTDGWHPFKDWQISIDARPKINIVKPGPYPWILPAVGIASRYMF